MARFNLAHLSCPPPGVQKTTLCSAHSQLPVLKYQVLPVLNRNVCEEFIAFPLPSPFEHLSAKAECEENKAVQRGGKCCVWQAGVKGLSVCLYLGQHRILIGRGLSPEALLLQEVGSHCALPWSDAFFFVYSPLSDF